MLPSIFFCRPCKATWVDNIMLTSCHDDIEKNEQREENGRRVDDTFLLPQKIQMNKKMRSEHLERKREETLLLVSLESLFIMHTPRCGKMKGLCCLNSPLFFFSYFLSTTWAQGEFPINPVHETTHHFSQEFRQ